MKNIKAIGFVSLVNKFDIKSKCFEMFTFSCFVPAEAVHVGFTVLRQHFPVIVSRIFIPEILFSGHMEMK